MKYVFILLVLISSNSYADEVKITCSGQKEYFLLPMGESSFENQSRTYVFKDGKFISATNTTPLPANCQLWNKMEIGCLQESSLGFKRLINVDRSTGAIRDWDQTPTHTPKYNGFVVLFKGTCATAKSKF